ncbi:hypothetical protein D910_08890 [Dendroctonus ponderosae]|uniref:non-specific serine/threonine protein kinase n=1 Tax=Dendroctonus ponderosae TaxID=77166 RepID=U4UNG6_DENPD|nr:hypothetical protein D910_08890 [Dendroctonus ponderosae]
MENHALHAPVPIGEVASIARLRHWRTGKIIGNLQKHKLLSYERGTRPEGLSLNVSGYDYLALISLRKRDSVGAFGSEISVVKEKNIYIVSAGEQERCLKLHRRGLLYFKRGVNKPNHHKRRSATKEFACMKVLLDRQCLVPQPYGLSRHWVVMELIKGTLLHRVQELNNVKALYDKLMNNIMRFALYGVVHADFNEFNIFITHDERPVIIDFSHMLFTHHANAKMHFERDVNGVINFFKKRQVGKGGSWQFTK